VERQNKVLVVDDDEFTLRSVVRALGDESYQVVTAASGSEAIDLLKQGFFDLVLTDLKMPGVDGLEVLRQAREIAPQAVVLILTGYASLESGIEALREGAHDYLVKPCSDDELRLRIERGLERVRLAKERQWAEEALHRAHDELEIRVQERTSELAEANEALKAEIAERVQAEEKAKQYIRELSFLSQAATEFVELPLGEDIYRLIGEKIIELTDNAIVVVNSFDEESDSLCVHTLLGFGKRTRAVMNIMGRDPVGMSFKLDDEAKRQLSRGKLLKVPGGIYDLSPGIPRPVCQALEKFLGLGDVYALGFVEEGNLLGSVAILLRRETELRNRNIIETFANQASVALQRKQAEEALREYSERLEEMVDERTKELRELLKQVERAKQEWESTADSLPDLVCLIDDRGRIIRANRTVETWNLGRVVGVNGQGFHGLLHPGCADSSCYLDSFWKGAWEEALRGQPAQCQAYDDILKRHVLVRLQPWKDWGKGTAIGCAVVIVRDITEAKQAEEALKEYSERLEEMVEERTKELREAQEQLIRKEKLAAIGQLGASVGHELRNPLGVIKNSIYYLNMKLREADEKVGKHLKIIERETARANKIIGDLLGFARIKAPEVKEVQINALVEEALSCSFVPDNVTVVTSLEESLPPLLADPDQIEQVFINLILNAAQAVSDGGKLEIATRAEEGFIVTEFQDNGCGIPEENLGKLFEPLFTTKAKGIGLGLAVSKQIIEAHEGTIEVESQVGKGTTFKVRLPRGEA